MAASPPASSSGREARNLLLYGRRAVPVPRRLRAGPLTMLWEAGDLRYISHGSHEIGRRVYGAVRDRGWRTVPAELSDVKLVEASETFRLSFRSTHREGPIHFVWHGDIEGLADGTVTFAFDGVALSRFERNRIGLCVLHPVHECAGRRAQALHGKWQAADVVFPELVAVEQPIAGFTNLSGLAYAVPGVGRVDWTFEGDAFETEDQRNWIDASFKTYGTPLARPTPVVVEPGTRIEQRVTLRWAPAAAHLRRNVAAPERGRVLVRRVSGPSMPMPAIGVAMGKAGTGAAASMRRVLSARPAHVRVDLDISGTWREQLDMYRASLGRSPVPWELALHVGAASPRELDAVGRALRPVAHIARVLVYATDHAVAPADVVASVSERIGRGRPKTGPWVVGCRGDLYDLHRHPPAEADWLAWSMNPQAHASDPTSILETPDAARAQVVSVRTRRPATGLVVSPITLGSRHASEDARDPIYASLLGAAWFVAVVARLARSGVASVTLLDSVDRLGRGRSQRRFLERVLTGLFAANGRLAKPYAAVDPEVAVLIVADDTPPRTPAALLAANLSRETRTIVLPEGMMIADAAVLDESTAEPQRTSPVASPGSAFRPSGRTVTLGPLGTVRASLLTGKARGMSPGER